LRILFAVWATLSAALIVATFAGAPLLIPWLAVLAIGGAVATSVRGRVRRTLAATDAPARELAWLARLLAVLESQRFAAPRLVALREAIDTEGVPASREIARLRRLVEFLDARRNQLFAPIGAALFFTSQVALAIDAWRARCGPRLRAWIDAVAELEALASLATYAWERPADVFPELSEGPPCFEAQALGHPLLEATRCVRNHVRLGAAPRLLLVSGSNMSGKSTLLRSVGVAALLAQAGAPVCAQRLGLSPLAIGASMRVFDSLQEGRSQFYNEIRRLRSIVEQTAGARAVLFLLDEILHGTNSHDRRIGAEAVVRSLVDRGGIGLVTTHDLALAQIAEDLGARAANVHFEDQVVEGAMRFDYRMRPGVVTRSNALALMRAIGLEV
jgi:CBS domain-containing protein